MSISFLLFSWTEIIAFFQLEVCSSVTICFLSFYWIIVIIFFSQNVFPPWASPFFHSVELNSLLFSARFVREYFVSSILLNWVDGFFSTGNLFVREHVLSSILLNWVHCCLPMEDISSVSISFLPFSWIKSITNRNFPPSVVSYLTSKPIFRSFFP